MFLKVQCNLKLNTKWQNVQYDSTAGMNENTEGKIYASVHAFHAMRAKKRSIYKVHLSTREATAPNNKTCDIYIYIYI